MIPYPYGQPGTPIRGSRLIRSYCEGCGEPIRVEPITEENPKLSYGPCTRCRANLHPGCGKPSGDAHTVDNGDPSPWEENAIRAMENR